MHVSQSSLPLPQLQYIFCSPQQYSEASSIFSLIYFSTLDC